MHFLRGVKPESTLTPFSHQPVSQKLAAQAPTPLAVTGNAIIDQEGIGNDHQQISNGIYQLERT
jgi:hypothetical protein